MFIFTLFNIIYLAVLNKIINFVAINQIYLYMEELQMKLGNNIGAILLEIAQKAIQDGNPQKAIDTYTKALNGFSDEYVIKLLRNEYVLVTDEDCVTVNLTDLENDRNSNKDNITDWNFWIERKLEYMTEICKSLNSIEKRFERYGNILDFNITIPIKNYFGLELAKKVGLDDIVAKLIVGEKCGKEDNDVWDELCSNVKCEQEKKYEMELYLIVKYVDSIRSLHKEYMDFAKSYEFIINNGLADRPLFFEKNLEFPIKKLCRFSDTKNGYYHPICNTKLSEYKKQIIDDVNSTPLGNEYIKVGIVEKNIMDGYDAGWLSPDGKFYGENGSASNMIHLNIAERLTQNGLNGDRELENEGWIKIHDDEAYGCFIGDVEPSDDFPYSYCPTETQIKMICDYIDKYHNGKLYTRPKIVEETDGISTYKLRQMDKVMLHKLFGVL